MVFTSFYAFCLFYGNLILVSVMLITSIIFTVSWTIPFPFFHPKFWIFCYLAPFYRNVYSVISSFLLSIFLRFIFLNFAWWFYQTMLSPEYFFILSSPEHLLLVVFWLCYFWSSLRWLVFVLSPFYIFLSWFLFP